MSKQTGWKTAAAVFAIIVMLTKLFIVVRRIAYPRSVTTTPDYFADFTFTPFTLRPGWDDSVFDNVPRLNISDDDLKLDMDLLKQWQNSKSDDDFMKLVHAIQKQKAAGASFQPKPATFTYDTAIEPENTTYSHVPLNDSISLHNSGLLNDSAQPKDVVNTKDGVGSHNSVFLKSLIKLYNPVPSNDSPYLSSSNLTNSANPLQPNETARSSLLGQLNNSTWLFHKLVPVQ